MSGRKRWRWIRYDGATIRDVGIDEDGALHNPNGYPEAFVRAAIDDALADDHRRRKVAAAKAAETRRRRRERKVYEVARRIADGGTYGPAHHCAICGRGLGDPEAIRRGIGSECWQDVLDRIEANNCGAP